MCLNVVEKIENFWRIRELREKIRWEVKCLEESPATNGDTSAGKKNWGNRNHEFVIKIRSVKPHGLDSTMMSQIFTSTTSSPTKVVPRFYIEISSPFFFFFPPARSTHPVFFSFFPNPKKFRMQNIAKGKTLKRRLIASFSPDSILFLIADSGEARGGWEGQINRRAFFHMSCAANFFDSYLIG